MSFIAPVGCAPARCFQSFRSPLGLSHRGVAVLVHKEQVRSAYAVNIKLRRDRTYLTEISAVRVRS